MMDYFLSRSLHLFSSPHQMTMSAQEGGVWRAEMNIWGYDRSCSNCNLKCSEVIITSEIIHPVQ